MLVAILSLLIWLAILFLIGAVVVWVLRDLLGVAVPAHILKIVAGIVVLIVLLWFVQLIVAGPPYPRLLL
jgi:hypothetical protein